MIWRAGGQKKLKFIKENNFAISNFVNNLELKEKLLLLYVAFIPFMKMPNIPLFMNKVQFSDIIFLGIFVCCFMHLFTMTKFLFRQAIFYVLIAFALINFFSLIKWGVTLNGILEYAGIIYLISLFAIFIFIIRRQNILKAAIITWVIVSAFVGCLGFLGLSLSWLSRGSYNNPFVLYCPQFSSVIFFPRIVSTFRNPNMFLTYLHISLGLAIFLFFATKKREYKKLLIFAIIILFANILFTGSRHIVGVLLSLFLLAFLIRNIRVRYFISFILGLFFITSLVVAVIFTRWTIYPLKIGKANAIKELNISLSYADSIYYMQQESAIKMIKRHPFFGIGIGKFPETFMEYIDWDKYNITLEIEKMNNPFKSDPHSTYLGIFAETGIFGLISFLFIFYFIFKYLFEMLKKLDNDKNYAYLIFSFLAIIIGFLLNAFIIDIASMRHYWVFLAFIVSQRNILAKTS